MESSFKKSVCAHRELFAHDQIDLRWNIDEMSRYIFTYKERYSLVSVRLLPIKSLINELHRHHWQPRCWGWGSFQIISHHKWPYLTIRCVAISDLTWWNLTMRFIILPLYPYSSIQIQTLYKPTIIQQTNKLKTEANLKKIWSLETYT